MRSTTTNDVDFKGIIDDGLVACARFLFIILGLNIIEPKEATLPSSFILVFLSPSKQYLLIEVKDLAILSLNGTSLFVSTPFDCLSLPILLLLFVSAVELSSEAEFIKYCLDE